jgi:hypothetical protein
MAGLVADAARDELVDRDPGADVGRALFQTHPGQERAHSARMVAGAIRTALAIDVLQAADDLHVIAHGLQRLQRPAEGKVAAGLLGPPVRRDRAVREKEKRGAQWCAGCRGGQGRRCRRRRRCPSARGQGNKGRQREGRAEAAKEVSSGGHGMGTVERMADGMVWKDEKGS